MPLKGFEAFSTPQQPSQPSSNAAPLDDAALQHRIEVLEAALTEAGMGYTRKGNSFDLLSCPWVEGHTDKKGGASTCIQSDGVPGFNCFHGHCQDPKRSWKDFKALLEERIGRKIIFGEAPPKAATSESGIHVVSDKPKPVVENVSDDAAQTFYPPEIIDGDLLGDLTRALTDGTSIPPQFVRETIKVGLGTFLDGVVGFPNHENLHQRTYLHLIASAQTGKGESWKRVLEEHSGWLWKLVEQTLTVVDGGHFGSGPVMVKILKEAPHNRVVAYFDEMSDVFTKEDAIRASIERNFLTLGERTQVSTGSFSNGEHKADVRFSFVGHFTPENFEKSFVGRRSGGSGYLSRGVFIDGIKTELVEWDPLDVPRIEGALEKIKAVLESFTAYTLIPETPQAAESRRDFVKWLHSQDVKLTPRLAEHFKRDCLLRAVFGTGEITADVVERAAIWGKLQYSNRVKYWPLDVGNAVDRMCKIITKRLEKGPASERALMKCANVQRDGTYETFQRAMRALLAGHVIKTQQGNTTRKGSTIYELDLD